LATYTEQEIQKALGDARALGMRVEDLASMEQKLRNGDESGTVTQPTQATQGLANTAGKTLGQLGGSYAANQAMSQGGTQAASQLAQTAAQNQAYNAAATAATQQAAPTVLSNAASMGALPMAGVAAGTLLTAKGLNDLRKGRTDNTPTGKASRVQTAISTFGFSEAARALGLGQTRTNVEDKKLNDLKKQGLLGADFNVVDEKRSTAQQLADIDKAGTVIPEANRNWLKTGDTKYLNGDQLQGYGDILKFDPRQNDQGLAVRRIIGDEALKRGIVNPNKGTMDIKADEDFNKYAEDIKAAQTSSQKLDELVALGKITKEQAQSLKGGVQTTLSNSAKKTTQTARRPQEVVAEEPVIENPVPVTEKPQVDLSALADAYKNVSNQNATNSSSF